MTQSTSSPSTDANHSEIRSQDQQFVMQAAQGGMAEVELGRLAMQKASSSVVKSFGQHMVKDHTQANNQLKQLASQKGIPIPTDTGTQNKATKAGLSKLSGTAFDRALMNQMVMDHQKTVSLFEKEAQQGQDLEVKAWAAQTLPTLRDHLRMALSTQHGVSHSSAR
ncbi:MAG: DUF4142 domain-containing protein [Scytolyngbya sp. HA4215-MV1]|nr:DUF4142 domain-containing protein [Scytolyngbya sp. HA4215-MV1]